MALTDDQVAFYHRKLGTGTDMTDVETRLDRLGDPYAVVLEILEERHSTLVASPASFVVPGEYSQDTRENIKQLAAQIVDARNELAAGGDVDENIVEIQAPYYAVCSNPLLGTEEYAARGYARRGRGR